MTAKKTTFEKKTELVKALAWPTIFLLVLVIYFSEISSVMEILPKKIQQSSKITIGSFSFEVEKAAKEKGNLNVFEALDGLNPTEVELLLRSREVPLRLFSKFPGHSNWYVFGVDLKNILVLEQRGLLSVSQPRQILFEGKKRFVSKDFSNSELEEVFADLKWEYREAAIKELASRGYIKLAGDLLHEDSKVILDKIFTYDIKKGKDGNYQYFDLELGPEEEELFRLTGIKLTPIGKQAFDLIVEVVGQQFSKSPD